MMPGLRFSSECLFQLLITESCGHHALFSAMFIPIHSITNKEQYEKHHCNQSSYYGNIDNSSYILITVYNCKPHIWMSIKQNVTRFDWKWQIHTFMDNCNSLFQVLILFYFSELKKKE